MEGELSKGVLRRIAALNITVLTVKPLSFRNTYEERCALAGGGQGAGRLRAGCWE